MVDADVNNQVEFIFKMYDKDKSGTIEVSELKVYFADMGMRLSSH